MDSPGLTWTAIERAPDPWGNPCDYATFFNMSGLNSPRTMVYDRVDPAKPHGNRWGEGILAQASGFVATDVNMIYFEPTKLPAGQYYRKTGPRAVVQHFSDPRASPKNVGGFHGCVIETGQPGSTWHLLVRFADIVDLSAALLYQPCFGGVLSAAVVPGGPDLGARPQFVILAHPDLLLHTSYNAHGKGNERRGLTKAADITLPSDISRILISDVVSNWEAGPGYNNQRPYPTYPPIFTCAGDGFFPVFVGRDEEEKVRKISVLFMGGMEDVRHGDPVMTSKSE